MAGEDTELNLLTLLSGVVWFGTIFSIIVAPPIGLSDVGIFLVAGGDTSHG